MGHSTRVEKQTKIVTFNRVTFRFVNMDVGHNMMLELPVTTQKNFR